MAAAELLDFNQVQEQSANTGEAITSSGGLQMWNFRCDPNLACDLSQTYFAMDIDVRVRNQANTEWIQYIPDRKDFKPFFPLTAFSSMSHIIDGVTVAHSNQPYVDKLMQEKYLHDTSVSNLANFESLLVGRSIDDLNPVHNIFMADSPYGSDMDIVSDFDAFTGPRMNTAGGYGYKTMLFQPPFDLWTKHQRMSGGNHQIQLNLKSVTNDSLWGEYMCTPCPGLGAAGHVFTNSADDVTSFYTGDQAITNIATWNKRYINRGSSEIVSNAIRVDIKRVRLLRRMVRFTIERPIGSQDFNLTEMAFFHGTPSTTEQTQNFLLPSSTFGIAFYWRKSTDSSYMPFNAYPSISSDGTNLNVIANQLKLDQFYFTYGGETYPSQRITGIDQNSLTSISEPAGGYKMQVITHQLQGVLNTDQERFNVSFGGRGLIDRMDASHFFFPVSKHNNSDNSDLQVYWKRAAASSTVTSYNSGTCNVSESDSEASLVVVAFYDARLSLGYNQANQLEKVTKVEWK